jgi:uncharacterized protein YcbK (DUF882 family)
MRGSEYSAPRDARSAGRVGAGGREPGQSVCVRYGKAQSSGFAAGRAVLGKDRLLAGFKVIMSAGRGGAAAQLAVAAAFIAAWVVPNSTESAVANGDTRTVVLSDQHTNESGSFTFMVNGVYDQAVLDKLNWFCRDWRLNEPTKMDPHLFDIIWEVYRESGSTQPIDVLSAYRSPQTNAMLRRRSRQVAEHSQHMEGKAIDAHFIDVGTARIRDIAMRMEDGGVGFYPTGITPWVHIDSGSVRYWPRMSRDAMTRLFPDGKTVFIPADGQPMPGYEQARAEIEARGGEVQVAGGGFGIFSWLFGARGGGADDAEEEGGQEAATTGNARGGRGGGGGVAEPQVQVADAGPEAVAKAKRNLPTGPAYADSAEPAPAAKSQALVAGPEAVAAAKRNLPTGPAYASAAEPAPEPPVKPEVVATLEQPDIASDASPIQTHGAFGAKSFGPLPPRRPADLDIAAALAGAPMPPARPAELILASAENQSGGAVLIPPPSIAQRGLLPKVITSGVDTAPTGALALAETQPGQKYDDSALLARAAELTVALPPMPIPNVATSTAASQPAAAASQPKAHGGSGVLHSAKVAAQDLARMFGGLPFGAFKTAAPAAAPSGDLRGPQQ